MQVVNVEYLNKLNQFPDIVVVLFFLAILVGTIIMMASLQYGEYFTAFIATVVVIAALVIIASNSCAKTDEVKYKEVIVTDDEIPASLLEEYEITKERGDIYRLTPIDNKTPEE